MRLLNSVSVAKLIQQSNVRLILSTMRLRACLASNDIECHFVFMGLALNHMQLFEHVPLSPVRACPLNSLLTSIDKKVLIIINVSDATCK